MHFFLPFSSIFLESRVHIEVVYIVYMQRWSLLDFLLYGVQIEGMSVMIREREKKKKRKGHDGGRIWLMKVQLLGETRGKNYCNWITTFILFFIQLRILPYSFAYVWSYCACMLMNISYAHHLYWNCHVSYGVVVLYVCKLLFSPALDSLTQQLLNTRTSPFSKFAFEPLLLLPETSEDWCISCSKGLLCWSSIVYIVSSR